ncbi:MAG: hypothetical protein ACNS62_07075 [Candidatus Cyclobacteriaceae bacterium M3_2C_046]
MKMYKIFILFLLVIIYACQPTNQENTENENQTPVTAVSSTDVDIPVVRLADFDAEAGKFKDQEVMVKGIVDHVCKHGGKKLFLVDDGGDLHVESDQRFDDKLAGSEVMVKGIVRELRIDEAYCLKMEEDNIQSHKTGETDQNLYQRKQEMINSYRDSMKAANKDHLSFYSLEYISLVAQN